MEPRLTLSFTPEKQDYIRASRILSRKSPWFLILAAVILLLVMGSGLLLIFPGLAGDYLQGVAPFVLIAGLVYLLYVLFLIPMQLSKAYQTKSHLSMARTLTFYESHLRMRIGDQGVDLPWEKLRKVIDGGDYFLMLFQADEQVFPFIPGRAFEHQGTREALLKFFREKSIPVI